MYAHKMIAGAADDDHRGNRPKQNDSIFLSSVSIARAKLEFENYTIEVWSGVRFIVRLDCLA
jgi:hypothetical protein